ncbi:invasion associated locus B family protein [Neorhizobium sp. P12A]|nr:invasion associated locus B family protein [Neorhizobium sp. P12A]
MMRTHLKAGISAMALLSCMAFAPAGFAEDAAKAPVAAQTGSSPKQAAPMMPPQDGQAAGSQQQANVTKFDDWYYRCVDGKAADSAVKSSCEVAQIATVKQGDQTVNVLTLAFAKAVDTGQKGVKPAAPGPLLTTLVPLNVYLPAGLSIDAGDKQVVQLAYRNCNQTGCWAQQEMTTKTLATLQKSADGVGHLQLMDGRKVNIKFSLKGLWPALDAMNKPAAK